jgi:hypothetical protein
MVGNTIPNERGSSWDLPSGVFPHMIERVILARQQVVVMEKEMTT